MESRFPTDVSQAAAICSDLLRLGVDMLVTGGTAITVSAKQATSTVPIVGMSLDDPVATGLVQSLARPGGNVTGMSLGNDIVVGKLLEVLQKIEPTLSRVGFLYNPESPGHVTLLGQFTTVAAASGVEVVPAEVRATADIDGAFEKAIAGGAEALFWPSCRRRIGWPVLHTREWVPEGTHPVTPFSGWRYAELERC